MTIGAQLRALAWLIEHGQTELIAEDEDGEMSPMSEDTVRKIIREEIGKAESSKKSSWCKIGAHKWARVGEGLGNSITNFITDYKCERCGAEKRESLFDGGLPY